jgi:hypothetical protein
MQLSASQLFYRLLDGPADLRPLRILGTREFVWLQWAINIHILGASHAVEFRQGEQCITELLTCARTASTQEPLIGLDANVPGDGCVSAHGLVCRVRLAPICLADGDALRGCYPDDGRFEMCFPCGANHATPVTRVGWRAIGQNLAIETIHSYPEENRGVRSVSLFVQREPR